MAGRNIAGDFPHVIGPAALHGWHELRRHPDRAWRREGPTSRDVAARLFAVLDQVATLVAAYDARSRQGRPRW